MDKFLVIYNVKDITFPLCGFITEENRNILLRKFEECYEKDKDSGFRFYVNEDTVDIACSEIVEALKNPFSIDMRKVPQEIMNYDLAAYIAEREMFFEVQEDGTLRERHMSIDTNRQKEIINKIDYLNNQFLDKYLDLDNKEEVDFACEYLKQFGYEDHEIKVENLVVTWPRI